MRIGTSHPRDKRIETKKGRVTPASFGCALARLTSGACRSGQPISNMETWALPKISFSLASALMLRLLTASCRPVLLDVSPQLARRLQCVAEAAGTHHSGQGGARCQGLHECSVDGALLGRSLLRRATFLAGAAAFLAGAAAFLAGAALAATFFAGAAALLAGAAFFAGAAAFFAGAFFAVAMIDCPFRS